MLVWWTSKKTGKSQKHPWRAQFPVAFKAQSQNLAIYLETMKTPEYFHCKTWMVRITPWGKKTHLGNMEKTLFCVATGCRKLSCRTHSHGVSNWQELGGQWWSRLALRSILGGRCFWQMQIFSQSCPSDCPAVSTVTGLTGATVVPHVSP